jgi:hypothetical protein
MGTVLMPHYPTLVKHENRPHASPLLYSQAKEIKILYIILLEYWHKLPLISIINAIELEKDLRGIYEGD